MQRHYFSSSLQRMSVVCKVTNKSDASQQWYSLVKGSPEAIRSLLSAGTEPSWYDSYYKELARKGLRILALACKRIVTADSAPSSSGSRSSLFSPENMAREEVESNLYFCGFIAFECKIRADSPVVIRYEKNIRMMLFYFSA